MVINRKVTGKAMAMPVGLGLGWLVSILLTLVGTLITAHLVITGKISEEAIGYVVISMLLFSSAAGAWLSGALIKRRWMVVCLGAGGSYYLTLLGITALFFGGQYQGMGVTALVILGGCGAVGLLGIKRNFSTVKKRKRTGFR